MLMYKSSASAAASKAAPRFAEVAGRARRSDVGPRLCFFLLTIRVRLVGLLCLIQGRDHRMQSGIQYDRRMAKRFHLGALAVVRSLLEESAAMEVHGEVGVLKKITCKD